MTETTLYERLLGIERPWRVRDVRLALEQGDIEIGVELAGETLVCPACGARCPGYDRRSRTWRHLDTMQYRTLVRAEVPRVRCDEHGSQQVPVPWADAQARLTVVNDLTASESCVLYVADGRDRASLDGYFDALGDQRQDPVDQAAGLRVPQPRAVPQHHLLPSGRARPLPGRDGCPHEILKRPSC